MIAKKLYTLLFTLAAAVAFGQQKQVQASIDSTKIKIGAQVNLTLKATVDTSATVTFPEGKTFGFMEVLESYPVDTTRNGAIYELVKKYGLTQFDSGRYVIPPLPVIINNKNIKTDSLIVEVHNIPVDTLKQKMYDIKPVLAARSNTAFWWWLVGIIVLLAGMGYGIWQYLKKRETTAPKAEKEEVISPIERATRELQNLEKQELLAKGEIKDYYSRLTDIARVYIEEAIHVPAMESTTSELIEAMQVAVRRKRMNLSQQTFEELEKILRTADMVKFAKVRPQEFEIAEDRKRIEKTIVVIDKSIPEEKEEDDLHTHLWLEQQRKKKEKRRRRIILFSSIGGVVLLLAVLAFTVGKSYLQDNFFGHPTKELLEGEWVKSEYGYPAVIIETPRVLKRQNMEKMVPKETMALIKDMNLFSYGSMFEDFYIEVSTISYKKETKLDLNTALDGMVKVWESRGAKDILLKAEEFSTPNGITGLRSFGNMTFPDPITKKPERSYYEIYLFKQQNGLQQVLVIHREGDEAGVQILDRVKNSIELKPQTN